MEFNYWKLFMQPMQSTKDNKLLQHFPIKVSATETKILTHSLFSNSDFKSKHTALNWAANYIITIIQTGRKLRKISCKILEKTYKHLKNESCCNFLHFLLEKPGLALSILS